jgi:hypothetical protein
MKRIGVSGRSPPRYFAAAYRHYPAAAFLAADRTILSMVPSNPDTHAIAKPMTVHLRSIRRDSHNEDGR